jgi:hypothetical protein
MQPKHRNATGIGLATEARRLRCLVTSLTSVANYASGANLTNPMPSVAGLDPLAPSIFEVILDAF